MAKRARDFLNSRTRSYFIMESKETGLLGKVLVGGLAVGASLASLGVGFLYGQYSSKVSQSMENVITVLNLFGIWLKLHRQPPLSFSNLCSSLCSASRCLQSSYCLSVCCVLQNRRKRKEEAAKERKVRKLSSVLRCLHVLIVSVQAQAFSADIPGEN